MVKESPPDTAAAGLGWLQDQLYQLKAHVSQLEQQVGHLQALVTNMTDGLRTAEGSLREAAQRVGQVPRLQEELNQSVALLVHLQDLQAETKERLDTLVRTGEGEAGRDQHDWTDLARRLEQLERQLALWQDRQAGVDEVGRRFQEGLSLLRQELQQLDRRLEGAESKAGRGLEGATRAEHTLSQVDAAILALQREDEAVGERARSAADAAHRVETTLAQHLQALQRIELLAERVELHRAERQRLEERALKLDEAMTELTGRLEQQREAQGRQSAQQQGLASRLDSLEEAVSEQRALLVDQIRRLTASQDRTKRRQIQELERELREMRQYVADLTRE
jgi:chromosome segregation ATPase